MHSKEFHLTTCALACWGASCVVVLHVTLLRISIECQIMSLRNSHWQQTAWAILGIDAHKQMARPLCNCFSQLSARCALSLNVLCTWHFLVVVAAHHIISSLQNHHDTATGLPAVKGSILKQLSESHCHQLVAHQPWPSLLLHYWVMTQPTHHNCCCCCCQTPYLHRLMLCSTLSCLVMPLTTLTELVVLVGWVHRDSW